MKPSQVKEVIKVAIANQDNLLIHGEPGTAKTSIMIQAHEETKTPYILIHAGISDPTDWKGYPVHWIDENGEHKAKFIPFADLLSMIQVKTRTGVIWDDFGQAPESVQAPAMQIVHGGRLNGYTVSPELVHFILTNRRQDIAGVRGILEPVKSRVIASIKMDVDLDDWTTYAFKMNFSFEVIAFNRWKKTALLDFRPTKDMTNSPCPRTWEGVSKILTHKYPKEAELELISGEIGEAMAIEFYAFVQMARELPNPDMILLRPDEVEIPKKADVLYALCSALATKATEQTFPNIVKYANRLPAEYSVMLVIDCTHHNQKLVSTRSFVEWNIRHQNVLT